MTDSKAPAPALTSNGQSFLDEECNHCGKPRRACTYWLVNEVEQLRIRRAQDHQRLVQYEETLATRSAHETSVAPPLPMRMSKLLSLPEVLAKLIEAYRVEPSANQTGVCPCGHDMQWTITWQESWQKERTEASQSWGGLAGKKLADDICELMNMAFEHGAEVEHDAAVAESASSVETTAAPEFPYPTDRTGWICSVCHGWNVTKDKVCMRACLDGTGAQKASAGPCARCGTTTSVHLLSCNALKASAPLTVPAVYTPCEKHTGMTFVSKIGYAVVPFKVICPGCHPPTSGESGS